VKTLFRYKSNDEGGVVGADLVSARKGIGNYKK